MVLSVFAGFFGVKNGLPDKAKHLSWFILQFDSLLPSHRECLKLVTISCYNVTTLQHLFVVTIHTGDHSALEN